MENETENNNLLDDIIKDLIKIADGYFDTSFSQFIKECVVDDITQALMKYDQIVNCRVVCDNSNNFTENQMRVNVNFILIDSTKAIKLVVLIEQDAEAAAIRKSEDAFVRAMDGV